MLLYIEKFRGNPTSLLDFDMEIEKRMFDGGS